MQRYTYTLSVFLSETGSGTLPRLSRADLLRLVGVMPESKVHALLTSSSFDAGISGGGWGGAESGEEEVGADGTAADGRSSPASLAERMVATLGMLGGRVSTHAAACQTCDCEDGPGWEGLNWASSRSRRGSGSAEAAAAGAGSQQLAARLAAIEEEYKRKSGALETTSAASLEERMAAYQRECDARCAAQLAERLAALREGELVTVREEEAGRHAAALTAERAALAAAHQERLAALHKQVINTRWWAWPVGLAGRTELCSARVQEQVHVPSALPREDLCEKASRAVHLRACHVELSEAYPACRVWLMGPYLC